MNVNRPTTMFSSSRPDRMAGKFPTLVKQELGLTPLDPERLLYYLLVLGCWSWLIWLVFMVSSGEMGGSRRWSEGSRGMSGLWFLAMVGIPVIGSSLLGVLSAYHFRPTEFHFTRAISRRAQFRSQVAVTGAMVLLPCVVCLAWSLAKADLVIDSRYVDAARFLKVFQPDGHLQAGDPTNLVLPHGRIALAETQLWLMTSSYLIGLGAFYGAVHRRGVGPEQAFSRVVNGLWVSVVLVAFVQAQSGVNYQLQLLLWVVANPCWTPLIILAATGLVLRSCERSFCNWEWQ